MKTEEIWDRYNAALYFFILRRVKDEETTRDILQSSFVKIHEKKQQLKDAAKLKGWVFQLVRNETVDHFNRRKNIQLDAGDTEHLPIGFCCFDRFIEELPPLYRAPIELVYLEGKSQQEAAEVLAIGLTAAKGRIRRAKEMLKEKFVSCCKFTINEKSLLVGQPDCAHCEG